MAALMETAPSSGERTELSEPIIPPIGVRAEPAITMSLFMDFVLLQQNLVCILVLPIGLVWASGPLVWAPSLPVVGAGTRGVGYFSSGKNNSLRSDIFFPARKIPHTPLPTGSTGIPRAKAKKVSRSARDRCTESSLSLPGCKNGQCFYQAKTRHCPSARGGCWIFCRKKMSERSELFFKKNPTATPQARPHNRKSGSPNQRPPAKQTGQEPKPDLVENCLNGSNFSTGRVIPTGPAPLP